MSNEFLIEQLDSTIEFLQNKLKTDSHMLTIVERDELLNELQEAKEQRQKLKILNG